MKGGECYGEGSFGQICDIVDLCEKNTAYTVRYYDGEIKKDSFILWQHKDNLVYKK